MLSDNPATNQICCPYINICGGISLIANNLLEYNELYLEPNLTKSVEVRKPRVKPANPEGAYLKVYPNPAKDFITLEFNTGNDKANGCIEILDESGKKVVSRMLNRNVDQLILEIRSCKPGNYIVRLLVGNKIIGKSRFVVSR